jgi:hypothetical protein
MNVTPTTTALTIMHHPWHTNTPCAYFNTYCYKRFLKNSVEKVFSATEVMGTRLIQMDLPISLWAGLYTAHILQLLGEDSVQSLFFEIAKLNKEWRENTQNSKPHLNYIFSSK